MGAMPLVLKMQRNGILIDKGHFAEFSEYLKGEEVKYTDEVEQLTGRRINLASPDQKADLLFRHLGIKPRFNLKVVPTGKRYVIDDEVLESLKDYHPSVRVMQQFNECNKLRTSFSDVLPGLAGPDGRIRGNIRTTRVVSGRLSMTDPNLMAQPTRSDLGKKIRQGFRAPKGRKIGTIDLSQIQMRVVAHASGCINMIDTFLRNGDIHSENACRMFHLPVEKLDKMKHRYPAKRVGFGVVFEITAMGLRDQLVIASDPKWTREERQAYIDSWPEETCQRLIDDWYDANPEVREYMNGQHALARRFGMVWCMFGRHRLIPEVRSVHRWMVNEGLRAAGNHSIQAGEVGVMKLGMAEINDTIDRMGWDCMPLLQVHDELLFEGDEGLPDYLREFQRIYANCCPLDVPIKSDWAVGERWGELEK
jgi:DNA polymerase-1